MSSRYDWSPLVKRALASIAVLILAVGLSGCANKNAATQKF